MKGLSSPSTVWEEQWREGEIPGDSLSLLSAVIYSIVTQFKLIEARPTARGQEFWPSIEII